MATINIEYKTLPEDTWQTTTVEVADNELLLQRVKEELGSVFYRETE